MPISAHAGGPAGGPVIDDSGNSVALTAWSMRRYAIIIADPANTGNLFLKLGAGPAVWEEGIILVPGGFYEITLENLYFDLITAIAGAGLTQRVFTQQGG